MPTHTIGSNNNTPPRIKIFFLLAAIWETLKNIHNSVTPEISIKKL